MSEIVIARAGAEDVPALLPLLAVQLEDHGVGVSRDELARALSGLVARPERGRVLLARSGDRVVGLAVLPYMWTVEHGGLCAWLDELYVVPDMRERGVGYAAPRDCHGRGERGWM
jgi:hypothetical protein